MVKKIAEWVIIITLILIFIFSTLLFIRTRSDYKKGQRTYDNLAENVSDKNLNINFDKLKKINPDIIGWLYLKGTAINYPVVKSKNNDDYLHTKFDGTYGGCGTLFADYRQDAPFAVLNTIIYGHHMKDGTMFEILEKYQNIKWEQKHKRFELITPTEKYHLDVVAFLNVKSNSKVYQACFKDDTSKTRFIKIINEKAEYLMEPLSITENYVSLSTCAYNFKNARYIVMGKLTAWTPAEKKEGLISSVTHKKRKEAK